MKITEQILEENFKKWGRWLYYFAFQFIGNTQEAQDIVSEVFIDLWRAKEVDDIKGYLITGARLRSYKALRARKNYTKRLANLSFNDDLIDEIEHVNFIFNLCEAAKDLTPQQQHIFELYFKEGFRVKDIALMLQTSLNVVSLQKKRLIDQLKIASLSNHNE